MDEKLIDYFFGFAQSKGFKRNREDFVKYLQSDDKLFDYLYGVAESKGYKQDKEHFAGLVGRTQKAAPVTTESVKTEPVKNEVVNAEPVTEETATNYSGVDTTPMERKGERSTPIKGIDQITVEKVDLSDKEKADRLKSVKEATKDVSEEDKKLALNDSAVNNSIESKLMPVTEKTQVKEVTKVEPMKGEVKSDMPSYDDLGIEKGMNPASILEVDFDKDIKYKKLSPSELVENKVFDTRKNIKLERNISLRYPDPPGVVLKKENVGGKEVYSSYDKTNDKWYIYDEKSNKGNWTEVTSGPIKSMLNTKLKDSNIDYPTQEESNKIDKAKKGVLYNVYIPYVMKNYDNLSDEDKKEFQKQISQHSEIGSRIDKFLSNEKDPNYDMWKKVSKLEREINDPIFKQAKGLNTDNNQIDVKVKEVVPEEKKKVVPTDIKVKEVTKEEPMKEIKIKSKNKN